VLPQSPGINQHTGSGNLPGPTQGERAARSGVGTRTQRKLDHLARLRPDLLEEVRAATEAGIVKPPTPLERLRSAWKRASDDARREFLREAWGGLSEEDRRGIGG
jgi:hypothetical protein